MRSETSEEAAGSGDPSRRPLLQRLRSPPVEVSSSLPPPAPQQKLRSKVLRTLVEDATGQLPAVLDCPVLASEPTPQKLLQLLRETGLTFGLTKNLHVRLKLGNELLRRRSRRSRCSPAVRLECCSAAAAETWSFASKGLATVGQDEVSVALERADEETSVPRDVFRLVTSMYDSASKGQSVLSRPCVLTPGRDQGWCTRR